MAKKLSVFLAFFMTFAAAQIVVVADAHACSPGPSHVLKIVVDETPECLAYGNFGYDHGPVILKFSNNCDDAVELDAPECEACDTNVVIDPGEEATVTLENRQPFSGTSRTDDFEIEHGDTSTQRYSWTVGEQTGILETEVTFYEAQCGCFCSASSAPTPTDFALVAVVFLILAIRGRSAAARA